MLRLLEKRFGRVSASTRRRITACGDREALDRAIDLVLGADSIEQILSSPG